MTVGDGTVTVTWDNPNDATIEHYEFRANRGAGGAWDNWKADRKTDASTGSTRGGRA